MTVTPYILATYGVGLQQRLRVVSENLGNGATAGFRNVRIPFHEVLSGENQKISYAVAGDLWHDPSAGGLMPTDDAYNIALNGPGFFSLEGGLYTRGGNMFLNEEGELINHQGIPFLDDGGARITPPEGKPFTVSVRGELFTENGEQFAKLGVFTFPDERKLEKRGSDLYLPGTQTPEPQAYPRVLHKYLEGSNTRVALEMTQLTEVVSMYQATQNLSRQFYDSQREQIQKLVKTS